MVVCIREFVSLIRNTRVEDPVHILADQPLNMSMSKLGRITFGLAWDGFNSHLINLSGRRWRQDNGESKLGKERKPQRVIFIHVQDSWKSDRAVGRLFLWKRLISEIAFILVGEQIRNIGIGLFFSETAFTAVSGDEPVFRR